ncbi:tryptophan 2,3-dioxygenase family protein [Fulvivirga maritima]|uniref:tryptophan 2,3-dioxygenase family protein n=1 Tax=Fulvivirga maritima TaxID=2904247 RepID=UPI001F3B2207|nr:tryptophan 2,3-dioxygenase family protein [Fulvivirga maritima]UII24869.1 tryptophan 2,3-dioxygenase family protein [Fulvivirga maritima]
MQKSEIDPKILEQVRKLEEKYEAMGQDLASYLDGLLYSDYTTYWDYIHLDTLLSLQTPKTGLEDEMVFIIYHQHSELFFKLILWELEQIGRNEDLTEAFFIQKIERVNRIFKQLADSFSIMIEGLDKEQFLKFRTALLPASGFQSAQYRLIEMTSTSLNNLIDAEERPSFKDEEDLEELLKHIYWKRAALELSSGKKTLTLQQFEEKYTEFFISRAKAYKHKNIEAIFNDKFSKENHQLVDLLKEFDYLANVYWPLTHYKSAVKHLHKDESDIAATGGTNWQKYLPPRFQKVIFFPELWSEAEKKEWGKSWVLKEALGKKD